LRVYKKRGVIVKKMNEKELMLSGGQLSRATCDAIGSVFVATALVGFYGVAILAFGAYAGGGC
jgi:hypothetical protein